MKRKPKLPATAFILAEIHKRPRLNDGVNIYGDATTAFYQLMLAVCPELDPKAFQEKRSFELQNVPNPGIFYPVGCFYTVHDAPPRLVKILDRLFNNMNDALTSARLRGIERGGETLIDLAKGKITVAQLNDASVKGNDDV